MSETAAKVMDGAPRFPARVTPAEDAASKNWKGATTHWNGSWPLSVFGSRVTNHKKLSPSATHLRHIRWTAKPLHRQFGF